MAADQPPRICPICQSPIQPDEARVACADCNTRYHAECWDLNQGCAVYGCAQVPPTEKWSELEIPAGHWGQQHKPCPACGQQIMAAAIRCRHCGATFASAAPQSQAEFQRQCHAALQQPGLRRGAVVLFICNVLTCLAPFAALFGLIWYAGHRRAVRELPPFHRALVLLGLFIGGIQTVLIILMSGLYALHQ